MGHADHAGGAAGDREIVEGAAAALVRPRPVSIVIPEVHRQADHVRAFAVEEKGGDGRVHAPGHRDGNTHRGILVPGQNLGRLTDLEDQDVRPADDSGWA